MWQCALMLSTLTFTSTPNIFSSNMYQAYMLRCKLLPRSLHHAYSVRLGSCCVPVTRCC